MNTNDKLQHQSYYDQRFGQSNIHPSVLRDEEKIRWHELNTELKRILSSTNITDPAILDFGCGRGWLCDKLTAFGSVTGVDLSPESVNRARQFFPKVKFICLDASVSVEQQLPHSSFDIIVSSEVVEHIDDQQTYFDNMYHLLKPGGYLVMTTPNGRWKAAHFSAERQAWKQPLENWLTAGQLVNFLHNRYDSVTVRSFNAWWIFYYPPSGIMRLAGSPAIRRLSRILLLRNLYLRLLENCGYGLYLIVTARKKK